MPNNLDLPTLIRCLEVMADENSWEESVLTNGRWLIDATEAPPWEVAKEALEHISQANKVIEAVTTMGAFSLFDPCPFCEEVMLNHTDDCAYTLAIRLRGYEV